MEGHAQGEPKKIKWNEMNWKLLSIYKKIASKQELSELKMKIDFELAEEKCNCRKLRSRNKSSD